MIPTTVNIKYFMNNKVQLSHAFNMLFYQFEAQYNFSTQYYTKFYHDFNSYRNVGFSILSVIANNV